MDDKKIIDLYLSRSEDAIKETEERYGAYLKTVAFNVLSSDEDAKECVNDTLIKAWDSIPPVIPRSLSAYLGRISRNIALNRYFKEIAEKRRANADLAFEELSDMIPDSADGRDTADEISLRDAVNGFLKTLGSESRIIFVKRYWYMYSVRDIAEQMCVKESKVKVSLMRSRDKFRNYLEKEGICF